MLSMALAAGALGVSLAAQQPAPGTPRGLAPIDLTGTWVSVVTEDWRFRMVTPPAKDYASVPLNAAARAIADKWDPAKDEAEGNACKSYGAANIMRVPGRLRISWQDDTTLKVETDTGTQTRVFHFGDTPAPAEATWQGHSIAQWNVPARSLKVVTTHLRPGYVRKNGAPYSDRAVVTEYWELNTLPNGDRWLTVISKVDDPQYFTRTYTTSSDFKKLPDAAGWSPTPCSAK
jgi:hypothetical protein